MEDVGVLGLALGLEKGVQHREGLLASQLPEAPEVPLEATV